MKTLFKRYWSFSITSFTDLTAAKLDSEKSSNFQKITVSITVFFLKSAFESELVVLYVFSFLSKFNFYL